MAVCTGLFIYAYTVLSHFSNRDSRRLLDALMKQESALTGAASS